MPPGRRGRRGGFAGSGVGRGQPSQFLNDRILGKRKGPDGEEINEIDDGDFNLRQIQGGVSTEKQQKRVYENQSSFANFMQKKGDLIQRFLVEKQETIFKSEEWLEKKERTKKVSSKHTKNLKQITQNDPYGDQLGSYQSIDGGISVKKPIKYCDFTGFHAPYQDPKTSLRYFNNDFYPYVKSLPEGAKNEYLAIRKANIILK